MVSSSIKSLNEPEVRKIQAKFNTLIINVDTIYMKTVDLYDSIEKNYKGKASNALAESFKPLSSHLDFLKDYCEVMNSYIEHTIQTFQQTDAALAKSLSGHTSIPQLK